MWDGGAWAWSAGILGFALGVGIGFILAYTVLLRDKRADHLGQELERQTAQFERYRSEVDEHFVRTSELFQEMTEQYRAVYEHLASGARALCSDHLVITKRMSAPETSPMVEHQTGRRPGTAELGRRGQPPSDGEGAAAPAGPEQPGASPEAREADRMQASHAEAKAEPTSAAHPDAGPPPPGPGEEAGSGTRH